MTSSGDRLSELLQHVLSEYPIDQIGDGIAPHTARDAIEQHIPQRLEELLSSDELRIKRSAGQGRWTAIPWVAIMDRRETEQIQDGIYVVYLFEPQEDRVTLTLNQGVTSVRNDLGAAEARRQLQETATEIRDQVHLEGFEPGPLTFPHASSRNELYGPGTIYYKQYTLDGIPIDEDLEDDVHRLVEAYQTYVTSETQSPPTIYQAPIKSGSGPVRRNYERTVLAGVPRERLEEICEVPVDHELVRVWGNREDTAADRGDYLLFAERDDRYTGEYTLLARITAATVLDPGPAQGFTEAVGWGEEVDETFPHVMFLEPIYQVDLDREDFWSLMDFDGWPNDTYSPIDFEREGSRFFAEYDSIDSFIEEIVGEQIYPSEGTPEYWQEIELQQERAEAFLSDPSRETFEAWLRSFPWYVSRWADSTTEGLFEETTPREVAATLQEAAEHGSIEAVLTLDGFGVTAASEALAAIEPEKFVVLKKDSATALETLQFEPPNPDTQSATQYDAFVQDVEALVEDYDLIELVEDVPHWATDFQLANFAFHQHANGEIDLSELIPDTITSAITDLLATEEDQPDLYRQALAHLVAGKNVVFYGPPGTGKTRAANRIGRAVCGSEPPLVTANAEWSNYQVVGGYRPAGESWTPDPGFLTEAARECQRMIDQTPPRPTWLIIDEMNRANLDEAFGDVFTLLDLDYRTREVLTYADQEVPVPLSFRILATMNTYDQAQLFSLGYAFRRRFAFVNVPSLLEERDTTEPDAGVDVPPAEAPTVDDARADLVDLVSDAAIDAMTIENEHAAVPETDTATIVPEYADEETLEEALTELRANDDLQTADLDVIETLVFFTTEITDREVIDVGQALLIDVTKYLLAHQLLFPEETRRTTIDEAIVAYIVPQFDHFMSELRRAETIDRDSDAGSRYRQIVQLARDIDFPKTAAVLEDAADSKRILS